MVEIRLPSDRFLVQLVNDDVILFEDGSEDVLVRFNVHDQDAIAKAQKTIYDLPNLSDEDKCFAHFWSGYFYGAVG